VLGVIALIDLLPFGGVPGPVGLYEAMVRTGHQTNAALLLAASVVLALRVRRHFCPDQAWQTEDLNITSVTSTSAVPGNLEVVA
jgi:hypothetical protein